MGMKKPKSTATPTPPDPDPVPLAVSDTSADVQSASRQSRKRMTQAYGRHKTILAGNTAQDNAGKKTILGG